MNSLKWTLCFSITLMFCLVSIAVAEDLEHKCGIELRGGYSLYLDNADPNSIVSNFSGTDGYSSTEFNESTGALKGGISLLYKTKDYFVWHIGANFFGTDSATAVAKHPTNGNQAVKITCRATELFLTANYYWIFSPRLNVQLGAGPSFYLGSLDGQLTGGANSILGNAYAGAYGRSFGIKADIGAELFVTDGIALRLGGGARFARISRFRYDVIIYDSEDPNMETRKSQTVTWANASNTFEVDFSGAFIEIGLRIYFDPISQWHQDD